MSGTCIMWMYYKTHPSTSCPNYAKNYDLLRKRTSFLLLLKKNKMYHWTFVFPSSYLCLPDITFSFVHWFLNQAKNPMLNQVFLLKCTKGAFSLFWNFYYHFSTTVVETWLKYAGVCFHLLRNIWERIAYNLPHTHNNPQKGVSVKIHHRNP